MLNVLRQSVEFKVAGSNSRREAIHGARSSPEPPCQGLSVTTRNTPQQRRVNVRSTLLQPRLAKPEPHYGSSIQIKYEFMAWRKTPALKFLYLENHRRAETRNRKNPVLVQTDASIDHDPRRPCLTSLGLYRALQVTGDRIRAMQQLPPYPLLPKSPCMNSLSAMDIHARSIKPALSRSSSQQRLDLVRLGTA